MKIQIWSSVFGSVWPETVDDFEGSCRNFASTLKCLWRISSSSGSTMSWQGISDGNTSIEYKELHLLIVTSVSRYICSTLCLLFYVSGSGDDSLDGVMNCIPRCPLTPSLSPGKRTTSGSKSMPPLLRTNKRTIYTAGRPPWYNVTGTTFKEAFVIGERARKLQI